MRSWKTEQGVVSVEWVGVTAAVALLVIGLILVAPGLAGSLSERVSGVICKITGGACPAESASNGARERPADRPTSIRLGTGGGLTALTLAADGELPTGGVTGGDPARCMDVGGAGDGAEICLGAGPTVAFCLESAVLGGRAERKTSGIPLVGTTFTCGDDPQRADPLVVLCGFESNDGSTRALLRCTATQVVGGVGTTGTCVNDNVGSAVVQDRTRRPSDCFGASERTPLKQLGSTSNFESAIVTLCADAEGAISVCTFTDIYDSATLGGLSGNDDFRALANVKPLRTDYNCGTASLVAGVADRLGLECEERGTQTARCTLAGRTIDCVVLPDRDGRPTYHHCQDAAKTPASASASAGSCAAGATTDPECPVVPSRSGSPFPVAAGAVPLSEVTERCPGSGRRTPLAIKDDGGVEFTTAFCAALAAQLGSALLQGTGVLAFLNGQGAVQQTFDTTPIGSPYGGLLAASNLAHQALAAPFGAFAAPLVAVAPEPGNPPGHVLVLQPDGSIGLGIQQDLAPGETPLALEAGQPFAVFAGANGAPGVLVLAPNALPEEIAVGHALAWAHQAFPTLPAAQQALIAALVSPASLSTARLLQLLGLPSGPFNQLSIGMRRGRPFKDRVKLIRQLKGKIKPGQPTDRAFADFEEGFRF